MVAHISDGPSVASLESQAPNESGTDFRLIGRKNLGLVLHFLTAGFVIASCSSLMQGLFLGYLGMPGYLVRAAAGVLEMPFAFSFPIGMLSDCTSVFGQRRKPYILLGWSITCTAMSVLSLWPLPAPCGSAALQGKPCKPASHSYTPLVLLMGLLSAGLMISCTAGRALLMDHAQRELPRRRGEAQASLLIIEKAGYALAVLISAFCFNGKDYLGTFDQRHQLGFNELCIIMLLPSLLTLSSCCFLEEPGFKKTSVREYGRAAWGVLSKKVVFFFVMYIFWLTLLSDISTPASPLVTFYWVRAKHLQIELAGLLGTLAAALGTWLAKTYLLHVSWKKLLVSLWASIKFIHCIPLFLAVFNVVRNPYFFLGEPLLMHVLKAIMVYINILIGNELVEGGNSGIITGIILTCEYTALPLATALSNQMFCSFQPNLSDAMNYILDSPSFQRTVALSYLLAYIFGFSSIALVALLPRQKEEAQQRMQHWPTRPCFAVLTAGVLMVGLLYNLAVTVASLHPKLSCFRFAGGNGCKVVAN